MIGKDCMLGAFVHLKPGVEIADGSILAIRAWMQLDQKCKKAALWLGKPATELLLSFVTKAARLEGKYID